MLKRDFWDKCNKEQLVDYIMFLQDQIKLSASLAKDYRTMMRLVTFNKEKNK